MLIESKRGVFLACLARFWSIIPEDLSDIVKLMICTLLDEYEA